MSVVTVHTACISGSQVIPVTIEVDLQRGLPAFSIIGLPDRQIAEAKERVKAAIKNSGFTFPLGKITVNLAPSSVHKQGTGFDLGIALGVLAASRALPQLPADIWFFGELSLTGEIYSHPYLVVLAEAALKERVKCVIAQMQLDQLKLIPGSHYTTGKTLGEIVEKIRAGLTWSISQPRKTLAIQEKEEYPLDSVYGQVGAKRALALALAGKHNLLLFGPAGCGKTMLVQRSAELLPSLSEGSLRQLARLYAFAGQPFSPNEATAPFRSPLYSLTSAGLLGGYHPLRPGEISLAHSGVLFLDEFSHLRPSTREALRIPMQEKKVAHIRSASKYVFPADTIVIAAQNMCPCGQLGVEGGHCRCTPGELTTYRTRLSEPILDRFDMFYTLNRVPYEQKPETPYEVSGKFLAKHIRETRKRVEVSMPIQRSGEELIQKAAEKLKLSMRAIVSLKKVAQTIACFEQSEKVKEEHIQEALQYRQRPQLLNV